MDPKKLAEEILDELFPQQEVVNEEADEEEDEEEGEEEETEEENDEKKPENKGESKGGNSSKNQASVSMKPSGASAEMPSSPSSAAGTQDLSGKGVQPFPGVGQPQEFSTTSVSADANRATLNMKPSFAGVQMPTLNKAKVQEDVKTLFGADVSEEFVEKASSLYEASLNTNLQAITEEMANIFEQKLSEEVSQIAEGLETKINEYLTYVVEEWVKENQLAVDTGLRTEIAENFISGLKNLFAESYIEVPEDKTDIFDEMVNAIENLENRVNEEMEKNISLVEKVALLEASKVFEEETKSLKSIDAENLRKLAENVEFSSVEDFRSKVKILVENYTKAKSAAPKATTEKKEEAQNVGQVIDTLMETAETNEEQQFINESIKLYSDILGRTVQG